MTVMANSWTTSDDVYTELIVPAIRDMRADPADYDLPAILCEAVVFDRHGLVFRRVAGDAELADIVKRHPKRVDTDPSVFSAGIWPQTQ